MSWLTIIAAILSIARTLTEHIRDKRLVDDATAAAMLKGLRESDDAISRAQKARQLVRDAHTRDPASVLRDDDGFKRRDE